MINVNTAPANLLQDYPEIQRYAEELPESIRDVLLGEVADNPGAFVRAIKALRLKEAERDYVMTIQRDYELACRPNESVKETMIRARLDLLRRRRSAGKEPIKGGRLPVDPLE